MSRRPTPTPQPVSRLRTLLSVALALLVTTTVAAGCGPSRENLTVSDDELLGGSAQGDFAVKVAEGDAAWANRGDRAQLEAAITAWETALTFQSSATDQATRRKEVGDVYTRLARAYYLLADGHIRFDAADIDDVEEPMKKTYDQGVVAAEKALYAYSPEYAEAVSKGTERVDALELLGPEAYGALYWYATNLGKWALLEGITEALGQIDTIYAMVTRVETEQPSYFYHAPFRYLGGYHTKVPITGPDTDKAREYFEKGIAADPNYLGTRVLYAEMYAYKVDDEELFREQLQIVLDTPANVDPEIEAENTIEKKKAQRLLDDIDDMF